MTSIESLCVTNSFSAKSSILVLLRLFTMFASEYGSCLCRYNMSFLCYYQPCIPISRPCFPSLIHPIHSYYCFLSRIYIYVHCFLFVHLSFLRFTVSSALDFLHSFVLPPRCATLRSPQYCYTFNT
jgi:hypothetical protein